MNSRAGLIAMIILSATTAWAADVNLRASWVRSHDEWLLRIEPLGENAAINPNSPALRNRRLIELVDAATGEAIGFDIKIGPRARKLRFFELVPEVDGPRNVRLTINGLVCEGPRGQRLSYNPTATANAPSRAIASIRAAPTPAVTPGEPAGGAGPTGGGRGLAYHPSPSPHPGGRRHKAIARPSATIAAVSDMTPGAGEPAEPQVSKFPFPPPRASTFYVIPRNLLVGDRSQPLLKDVQSALKEAFDDCEYPEISYHAVPDGFAMATHIERMRPDGAPWQPAADRWSLDVEPMEDFSLSAYLNALFHARPGQYRVIVFVVTPHPFSQTDVEVTRDEAGAWVSGGMNTLPEEIGNLKYTDAYECTALVYQFRWVGNGKPEFVKPTSIGAKTHLEKAGFLAALGRH